MDQIPTLDHLVVCTDHNHDNIQRMRTVYRFSSLMINHRESVAEHVWFVTMYASLVGEIYEQYLAQLMKDHEFYSDPTLPELNWKVLLSRITIHDLDECLSGDFLRTFKYSSPELAKAIKKATQSLAMGLFQSLVPGDEGSSRWYRYWENDKANDVEGRIVGWCDLLSVVSYCITEIRMGNRNLYLTLDECLKYLREVVELPEPVIKLGEDELCTGWVSFIRAQYEDLLQAVRTAVYHRPEIHLPLLRDLS